MHQIIQFLLEAKKKVDISFLDKSLKGFKKYSHGDNHQGYLDKTESKVKTSVFRKEAEKAGFRMTKKFTDPAAFHNWAYTANGGPYTDISLAIASEHGEYVRSVELKFIVDKS